MELAQVWADTSCADMVALTARTGYKELLKRLVLQNEPVDLQDRRGWRPLHQAAFNNQLTCLEILLEHEATDKNWCTYEGETAVFLACKKGHFEIVQKLLSCEPDVNIATRKNLTPLLAAVGAGSVNVTRILLEHEARTDVKDDYGRTPFNLALEHGHVEVLRCLLKHAAQFGSNYSRMVSSLLIPAMGLGDYDCIKLLLESGASADERNHWVLPIHLAVELGNQRIVELLLDNMSPESLDLFKGKEIHMKSILHTAVKYRRVEALDVLLSRGFNVDIVERQAQRGKFTFRFFSPLPQTLENYTPLGVATKLGYVDIMQKLIYAGSEVHFCTKTIRAPLLAAILGNDFVAVKLLVEHGAVSRCPRIRLCPTNLEAAALSIQKKNIPVLELLLRSGVDLNTCLNDHYRQLILFSVLVHGHYETPDDYISILKVLLNHISYGNYNKLLKMLMTRFQDNLEMVKHLQATLHAPHSLQHLCRVAIRNSVPLSGCGFEEVLKGFYVPKPVSDYLLFKY